MRMIWKRITTEVRLAAKAANRSRAEQRGDGVPSFQAERRSALAAGAAVLLALLPPAARAADESERSRIALGPWAGALKVGPGMNAAGRCLKGSRFVGENLVEARFDGCDLDGAIFYRCDLTRASFRGARLTGMNVWECRFADGDFTDAVINGIVGIGGELTEPSRSGWPHDVYLSYDQLRSTRSYQDQDLSRCVISLAKRLDPEPVKWDFSGMNLQEARFHKGDFTACDFSDARIDGTQFVVVTIDFRQLATTDNFRRTRALRGSRFASVQCRGEWSLHGMDLTGTWLEGIECGALDLTDAEISQCSLGRGITADHIRSTRSFRRGDLHQMKFFRIDFSRFPFSGVNMTGSTFFGCDFSGASFADSVVTAAQFSESAGLTVEQIKSTWNYKQGRMEGIILPEDVAQVLAAE